MSEKLNFTKNQQNAVDVIGGSVLVSAAAGSGKTAVLTQRAVDLLALHGVSADRLVIVTFTVAAAAEMKRRISSEISSRLRESPDNSELKRQQLLLANAHISTIHSLCSSLVHENFDALSLPPDIKIGEETQLNLLKNEAVNEVMEELYNAESQAFLKLIEFTCTKNDNRLLEIITQIYDFIQTLPFPLNFLDDAQKMYEQATQVDSSPWVDEVMTHARSAIEYALRIFKSGYDELRFSKELFECYSPAFESDLQLLKHCASAKSYNELKRILTNHSKARLSPKGAKVNPDGAEKAKTCRKRYFDIVDDIIKKLFSVTEEDFKEDLELLRPNVAMLFDAVRLFYAKIQEKKLMLSMMDYNDLEHFALNLLLKKDGEHYIKTPIGHELSVFFEQIMIDECQDINEVQELIFKTLSRDGKNLYMVGDVKQSIYSFRQACPELFVQKKGLYPKYDPALHDEGKQALITLEKNFRSRSEVCDTVNYIFNRIMSSEIGNINYNDDEKLVPAADYNEGLDCQTEFHLIDYSKNDDATAILTEAQYLATVIREKVDSGFQVYDHGVSRPCRYGDFAVLLRSANVSSTIYHDALRSSGVDCACDTSDGYFNEYEISLMLNLLRVIDNPMADLPLLSVLMSPLFSFTADDIVKIRLAERNSGLYIALLRYSQNDTACSEFLQILSNLREHSAILPVSELIEEIYNETDAVSILGILKTPESASANLRLMLLYAGRYESFANGGLSGFLRYIDRVMETKQDFSCANTSSKNANSVRILSIHKSKGLEFPICILADTGRLFNKNSITHPLFQLHSKLGFGIKITDSRSLKRFDTFQTGAIKLRREKALISEEMRVLYVALTRAKEKLIILSTVKNVESKLNSIAQTAQSESKLPPFEVYNATSFAEWLLLTFISHPDAKELRKAVEQCDIPITKADFKLLTKIIKSEDISFEAEQAGKTEMEPSQDIMEKLSSNFSFEYQHLPRTKIPTKLTVTQIAKSEQAVSEKLSARPQFMQTDEFTPAERGTLLHSFMQFADFALAKQSLESELSRLVSHGFLEENEVASLEKEKLEKFLSSSLCDRILQGEAHREYKFNFFINASEIDEALPSPFSEEKIFVQGIADCLIIEQDGIVLIDYKTDRTNNEKSLTDRYYNQLRLYKNAIEEIFNVTVKECLIYSLYMEKEIPVAIKE